MSGVCVCVCGFFLASKILWVLKAGKTSYNRPRINSAWNVFYYNEISLVRA